VPVLGHKDIRGLDVAVNNALGMRGIQLGLLNNFDLRKKCKNSTMFFCLLFWKATLFAQFLTFT